MRCPTCKGHGKVIEEWHDGDIEREHIRVCPRCRGTGQVPDKTDK